MKYIVLILASSCAIQQPRTECSVSGPYWARYVLQSDAGAGDCATLPGDVIGLERYGISDGPDASVLSVGLLPRRLGRLRQVVHRDDGSYARVDPSDPSFLRGSARGQFENRTADSSGLCTVATLEPSVQNYPETMLRDEASQDAGVLPALRVSYEWSNLRVVNTSRFPGTLFAADLHLTENACEASYSVYGVSPGEGCDSDLDCAREPNRDGGRVVGSALSSALKAICELYPPGTSDDLKVAPGRAGVCFPSVSFDAL